MSTTSNDYYTIDINYDEIKAAREQVFVIAKALYELAGTMTEVYEKFAPFCAEPGEADYPFDDDDEYLSDDDFPVAIEDICAECDTPCDLKTETKEPKWESLAIELLKAVFNCLTEICEKGEVD